MTSNTTKIRALKLQLLTAMQAVLAAQDDLPDVVIVGAVIAAGNAVLDAFREARKEN